MRYTLSTLSMAVALLSAPGVGATDIVSEQEQDVEGLQFNSEPSVPLVGPTEIEPETEEDEEDLQFETESERESESETGWEGTIGFAYQYNIEQSEIDSQDSSGQILPIIDLTYTSKDGKWSAGTDGLAYGPLSVDWGGTVSYELYNSTGKSAISVARRRRERERNLPEIFSTEESEFPALSLAVSVGRDTGRDANDPVQGLDKISSGILFGVSSSYEMSETLSLDIDVSRSFSNTKSLQVSGSLNASYPLSERAFLDVSGTTSWANGGHMQAFFGVSTLESNRTGLAPFSASSGLMNAGVDANLSYGLTEHLGVVLGASYNRLLGDAAKSPLVTGDTDSSLTFGVGYRF